MATRATVLDSRHVESLNVIDVVFSGMSKNEKNIRELWKQYLDHLNTKIQSSEAWNTKQVDLLVNLLHAMAKLLGFDMDKTHIKNQCYYPTGFSDIENDLTANRKALREVLSGDRPITIRVDNSEAPPQQKIN